MVIGTCCGCFKKKATTELQTTQITTYYVLDCANNRKICGKKYSLSDEEQKLENEKELCSLMLSPSKESK